MIPPSTDTILVFTKMPTPGAVKTRIAATIGNEKACELYRDWIGRVFRQLQPLRPACRVAGYFTGGGKIAFAEWSALTDDWLPQPPGDLGARLARAFAAELFPADPAFGRRFVLGTDCLDVTPEIVNAARAALVTHDAVFGPAQDGGYYLIGLRAPAAAGFFDGVRWSSEHALADQLERCRALGLTFALLPTLRDLDTEADWLAWQQENGA